MRAVKPSVPVNEPLFKGAVRCSSCRGILVASESFRLLCHHRFHQACLAEPLTKQISDNGGGSLKCPVCGDSIAVEANDALLKKCLDPGAYYKLHSARASQNNVPKPLREPDTSRPSSDERLTLKQKFERGWRPCPKGCPYLGNYPSSSDSKSIKCLCGYEYCRGCGVDERIIAAHDGRWHKTSCPYFERYSTIKAAPRASTRCPQCAELHHRCPFPLNDGYPDKLMRSLIHTARADPEPHRRPAPWAKS